jgi:hypothetical protein
MRPWCVALPVISTRMPADHAPNVPKVAPPSTWASLTVPAFRALWIAGLVSDLGAWMHGVGEGWLMTSLTASPRTVALLQAVHGVAALLEPGTSPVIGHFIASEEMR